MIVSALRSFAVAALVLLLAGDSFVWTGPKASALTRAELEKAARRILSPYQYQNRYDYNVTAGVRLLLFWMSSDDIGDGYIEMGTDPCHPGTEAVQLLMGSDPLRAPFKINHWGAAAEVFRHDGTDVFFGFMKASKGGSALSAKREIEQAEQAKAYAFEGLISYTCAGESVSATVPIVSKVNLTMKQFEQTRSMVMDRLGRVETPRRLEKEKIACTRPQGFLFTVRGLIDDAIAGRKAPIDTCYLYNSHTYRLKLRECERVSEEHISIKRRGGRGEIERTYRDLVRARFRIENPRTDKETDFEILLGTSGELRGVPIEIRYQPNWWFRITLHLVGCRVSAP